MPKNREEDEYVFDRKAAIRTSIKVAGVAAFTTACVLFPPLAIGTGTVFGMFYGALIAGTIASGGNIGGENLGKAFAFPFTALNALGNALAWPIVKTLDLISPEAKAPAQEAAPTTTQVQAGTAVETAAEGQAVSAQVQAAAKAPAAGQAQTVEAADAMRNGGLGAANQALSGTNSLTRSNSCPSMTNRRNSLTR